MDKTICNSAFAIVHYACNLKTLLGFEALNDGFLDFGCEFLGFSVEQPSGHGRVFAFGLVPPLQKGDDFLCVAFKFGFVVLFLDHCKLVLDIPPDELPSPADALDGQGCLFRLFRFRAGINECDPQSAFKCATP